MIETLGQVAIGFMIWTIGWHVFMAMDNYIDNIGEQQPKCKQKPQGAYDAVDWDAVSAKQKMVYVNQKLREENKKLHELLKEHGIVYEYNHENGTSFMMRKVDSDE